MKVEYVRDPQAVEHEASRLCPDKGRATVNVHTRSYVVPAFPPDGSDYVAKPRHAGAPPAPVIPGELTVEEGKIWRNLVTREKSKVAETLDEFRGAYKYNLLDENVRRLTPKCRRSGSGTTTR